MADQRDPILVELLERRIRRVFGLADVIVGRKDVHERYEVLGEPGPDGERPELALIPDTWLRDDHLVKIDQRLREAAEELEGGWRLIRHHRAAIGDMAEYAWVRPNLEMAKSDAASDAQEIHGEVVGAPEWVKRESDPVTYVWEIDSDHWYTLTELAEELGG